jgi:hypothetical protein
MKDEEFVAGSGLTTRDAIFVPLLSADSISMVPETS